MLRYQPVEKVPRIRTAPGGAPESTPIRGCGALFPRAGGPNRFRESPHRLSRGGGTLPAPLPGGAARRVCTRGTVATACHGLQRLDGSDLVAPQQRKDRPDPALLAERYREFLVSRPLP